MKVLHLISGGDTGGAKTHIISLLKGLDSLVDARVVCFIEDSFYEDAKKEGINIDVYKQKSRSDMSIVNRLADDINKYGYDIVHCHGARANFVAMFLKRKINKPMVTTIHSDYKLDFKDNFYKRLVYTSLNTIALKIFNYYIAISDSFKDMLMDRGFKEESIFVAYNGIDFEDMPSLKSKDEFLSNYNIAHRGRPLVGIVARLDVVKDHEIFIKAANRVIKAQKDIIFLIAGDGNEENRLKTMVSDLGLNNNVFFLGYVKDTDSFFNAIDINVLTSISESFPYVILEGARMKKTVITTNVGGIRNLIRDGDNGYLIEVGDWEALADRIIFLSENKNLLYKLGERLYNDVNNNYSSRAMGHRHLEIYKEILNKWR
ncbi:glycosyltransferase family 4 protein [Tissierella creatinini]|nr:glycosyltransferase family 4 protein [Tissierella creatinini]TJX67410.1 glycosyltransferase family 4 protein [Soehngenia saccharolytica]